jgi:hypothetical protein
LTWEEIGFGLRPSPILPQRFQQFRAQGDIAVLVPFALPDADDGKAARTPAAWMISLLSLSFQPCTPWAWMMSLIVLFQVLISEWVTSAKPYRVTFA